MTPSEFRNARESFTLSQAQWAGVLAVHPMTISKWERGIGKVTPSVVELVKVLVQFRDREFLKELFTAADFNLAHLLELLLAGIVNEAATQKKGPPQKRSGPGESR